MGPELFVLDQPAAELDPLGRKLVYANLCRLNREGGATTVLVEDRLDDVLPFLTRVVLMLDGRIVRDAPPDEFFADEALPSYGIRVPDARAGRQGRRPLHRSVGRGPVPRRPVTDDRPAAGHKTLPYAPFPIPTPSRLDVPSSASREASASAIRSRIAGP